MMNIIIIALIFVYSGYILFRHVKKSSKGKCAACELKEACLKNRTDC